MSSEAEESVHFIVDNVPMLMDDHAHLQLTSPGFAPTPTTASETDLHCAVPHQNAVGSSRILPGGEFCKTSRVVYTCTHCNAFKRSHKDKKKRLHCFVSHANYNVVLGPCCVHSLGVVITASKSAPPPSCNNNEVVALKRKVQYLQLKVNKYEGSQYLLTAKRSTGPVSAAEQKTLSHLVGRIVAHDESGAKVLEVQNPYNKKWETFVGITQTSSSTPQVVNRLVGVLKSTVPQTVLDGYVASAARVGTHPSLVQARKVWENGRWGKHNNNECFGPNCSGQPPSFRLNVAFFGFGRVSAVICAFLTKVLHWPI